jgi:tRNA(His) 5'-end guanylyltransferase
MSLGHRMNNLVFKYNKNEFHPYKYHIIRLNSKELLNLVNSKSYSIYEHILKLVNYNKILNECVSKLYNKFNPYLIYAFNNEINIVFFDYEVNNINKKLSTISSYFSSCMTVGLMPEEPIMYNGKVIEFDVEYETLNYLIWRQNDCKRNNTSMLCKYIDPVDSKSLLELSDELNEFKKTGIEIPEYILNGTLYKKDKDHILNMTYKDLSKQDFHKLRETLLEKYIQ